MKFQSIALLIAFAARANADDDVPCLAKCDDAKLNCEFIVTRNQFIGELGYYSFEGETECEGTNPTLGIMKDVTYTFIQKDVSNYYHPMGFAYGADGALDDQPELEAGVAGPGSSGDCTDEETVFACPAPMYFADGEYLGAYSNNAVAAPVNSTSDNFGLDDYEPQFFYPLYQWSEQEFSVKLFYDDDSFTGDFFYFCHIHQYMTGRIKFVDANGDFINSVDEPEIPYEYQVPSEYDASCGTYGLEDFQLPNDECPAKFVCDQPKGAVGKFASCIDSMNCAMTVGMTTNVNEGANSAVALFIHQMIPHHQNAVNMCKALLKSGEADCDDITDEDDSACIVAASCQEIINVQNAQIQAYRGVLSELGHDQTDDCVVKIDDKPTLKTGKKKKRKTL